MSDDRGGSRALVVVDVQHGFITPETRPVLPRLVRYIERPDTYELILATRFVNRPGSLFETERDWTGMQEGHDTEVVDTVERSCHALITKGGLAPSRDELLRLLGERALTRVDLCGFDTDQCVLATALLLWDAGIVPRLLADLCASSGGEGMHQAGLAMARRSIGDRNVVEVLRGSRPVPPTVLVALPAGDRG